MRSSSRHTGAHPHQGLGHTAHALAVLSRGRSTSWKALWLWGESPCHGRSRAKVGCGEGTTGGQQGWGGGGRGSRWQACSHGRAGDAAGDVGAGGWRDGSR